MMKQLIHKAKIMLFQPDEASGTAARQRVEPLDVNLLDQPLIARQMTAEQQRIQWLEAQNKQLRADVAQWKNFSIYLAHDLRESLKE